MNVSVYTSLFNVENEMFDIPSALQNWNHYADEIVVATLEGQARKTCHALSNHGIKTHVIEVDTTLDDPFFDGKLKNAALQKCSNDYVIQQDFDERIGGEKHHWEQLIRGLQNSGNVSFMLPVIDLYGDTEHFKGIGRKWYLHQKEGCFRGPVNLAKREDGTIDTDKSDTCELIDKDGNLMPWLLEETFASPPMMGGVMFNDYAPHVIHLGYLDLEKRIENNNFWQPVWSARNGKDVKVATSLEELDDENVVISHGLGEKWWK